MDRISLKDALEHDIWEIVWVGEPSRKISVEMTYNDLKTIVECLKKAVITQMKELGWLDEIEGENE